MNVLLVADSPYLAGHAAEYLSTWQHNALILSANDIIGGNRDMQSFAPDSIVLMPEVSLEATETLLAAFASSIKSVVYCSSCGAYLAWARYTKQKPGEPELIPLLEDDALIEESPFKSVENFIKSSGIPSTILRLPDTFGPGRSSERITEHLAKMDDGAKSISIDPLRGAWRFASAYNQDIGYAIASATKNSKALNKVYNVADSFVFTQVDWIRAIGRASGWSGSVLISDDSAPDASCDYTQHLIVDSSSIRQDLGYSEQIPINEALAKSVEWERANKG